MITFSTNTPQKLLNEFKKAIVDGDISTWEKDDDGDFTHKSAQWAKRAWLKPEVVTATSLRFTIIFSKNEVDKRLVYSYYHGHLIEAFLNHFAAQLSGNAQASPNPTGSDHKV